MEENDETAFASSSPFFYSEKNKSRRKKQNIERGHIFSCWTTIHLHWMMSLTEERINEMKEIFSMVDDDGDGSITRPQLGMCLRAMQYSISNQEINVLMKKFDSDKTDRINFPQLLQIIAATHQPSLNQQTQSILAALKLFDTNNDGKEKNSLDWFISTFFLNVYIETISENDFRFLMQQTGEPLSKDSVDDMIKSTDARTSNGRLQYRKLVSTIIHLWNFIGYGKNFVCITPILQIFDL